ncbi:hypothetical protein Leryth_013468 [Lithospermum erythrorhizon]|nr:hypothetical protein Leryth_013468 [Lithospermum erythrorhizon]
MENSHLSSFDIRVFYVRITNFAVPQYLSLTHIPLELNGARRDRVDKKSEEATFVTTDNIRFTGSVKFQVLDGQDVVLTGVLEMSANTRGWNMNCEPVITGGNTNYLNQESQNMKLINGSKMMHLDFTCGNSVPEEDCNSLDWDRTEYLEGGELSWFNAGVRVGVGIILEICVGVGVGVGLLVRTFQTTTRTVKRRLFYIEDDAVTATCI